MPSEEAELRLPNGGNADIGQRDSGHLAGLSSARWPDSEPASSGACGGSRLWSNQIEEGVYAYQRLSFTSMGRTTEERPRFQTGPEKSGRPAL